jgi:predicted TIM-barrel enzyme
MSDLHVTNTNNKKSLRSNLKFFSLRAKLTKKYLFYFMLILILPIPLFVANHILSHVKADSSTSFSFTAGGDIGGNSSSSKALDLIAQSGSSFHLAIGDLSYSEITPESTWCSYIQSHVGSTFPFELLSGNHEDGGEGQDGLIDTFVQCLPDRLGAVGTYGKEYYFDYPASSPIARFIMISPDLTFTNGGAYSYAAGTAHYNWVSNTIDNARAAGIKWVIVGMHKVCISMGIMPCDIGNDLMNLLVSKKVDLILQAHDHDYQRSKQLALNSTTCTAIQAETYNSNCVVNDGSTGNYTQGQGPVVVIVGTVGEGLHTINTSDGDAGYFANWMGNNVNPTNGLAQFTLSADQLTVSANFTGSTAPNNFTDAFTIAGSAPSPGRITLLAAATGNNGAGSTSLTIGLPAGTQSGDVLLAHVIVRTAGNVITAPTGWNLVLRQDSSAAISTASYVHVAGSSEPASYTWSFGTSGEASGGIASYIGVNTTTPVDASHAQYNASTSNVDNSGVTTTMFNDMLVYAVGIITTTSVNVPTGFTQVWGTSSTSSTTSEMSQEIASSIGATGTIHGTLTGGANSNITMLIALELSPTAPAPPPAGITLRAVATGNNGAGSTSLTIGLPAGTSSGDVLLAHVIVRTAGNVITPPTGWNLVLRQDSSSSISTASYVKVAGSTEPTSYTWSFGTSGQASGGIASYIGVNTTTPVDVSHAQYNASTSNMDNSGVTTTTTNDMLVYAVGIIVQTSVNAPTGFVEQWSISSNSSTDSEMSQEIFASTGATGTIHGTLNGGANSNITMLIALEPA